MEQSLHCGCVLVRVILVQTLLDELKALPLPACLDLKLKDQQSVIIDLLLGLDLF